RRRQSKNVPSSDREIRATEHLTASGGSDDGCESIFLGKRGDHLTGAQRVLVREQHHMTVKRSCAEAFGDKTNRAISIQDLEPNRHLDDVHLRRWESVDA